MSKYGELTKEVKNLISSNKTSKALEILNKAQLSELDTDLIIINGRFSKVMEDQRLGVIDDNLVQQKINRINLDILNLAELIEKPSHKTSITRPITNPRKFHIWWIIPFILVILVGIVYMIRPTAVNSTNIEKPGEIEVSELSSYSYKVTLKTTNNNSAGTREKVEIKLFGNNNSTDWEHLDNEFKKDEEYTFQVNSKDKIEELQAVELRIVPNKLSEYNQIDDLNIEKIKIEESSGNLESEYKTKTTWIGDGGNGDNKELMKQRIKINWK